jgi:hypothetical protein
MAALIDSSVLIAAERGDLAIDEMTRYLASRPVRASCNAS